MLAPAPSDFEETERTPPAVSEPHSSIIDRLAPMLEPGRAKKDVWRRVKFLLLGIALMAGGLAAVYLSVLLQGRTNDMSRYVRVDVWAVQQAEYEMQQFRAVFARHVAGDAEVGIAAVTDRLARARNTIPLLQRGPDYEEFRLLADIDGAADMATAALAEVDRLIGGQADFRDDLRMLRRVETLLARPTGTLRQLAVDLARIRLELQDGDLENVRLLTGVNRWMLIGFFTVTVVFIGFLLAEMRAARRAEHSATESERRTRYIAEHDVLTDLPNRMLFGRRLQEAMARAQDQGCEVALHVLDLDGFKDLNDTFGHDFGDQLLIAVAARLGEVLNPDDVLVRLGGDEFAVIQNSACASTAWEAAAQNLLAAFEQPFVLYDRQIQLATSIGIARFPADGQTAEDLLKAADLALYTAKERRGCVVAFHVDMLDQLQTRKQIEEALRRALVSDGLQLFYQPQVSLRDGRCTGAEALVRWEHEEFGWVSPATFIPIAEESGLILPLGRWVLETACRDALHWTGAAADAVVAVNVSPSQFTHDDIVEQVRSVLALTGLPPHRLELEITEGLLMRDEEAAIVTLDALHELGVKLAIDDFGTGYSSLSYLKRFNVHKLKIDRAFVRDIENDRDDQKIVRAIVELASGLGMETIAEGIETAEQLHVLSRLRCEEGQGYLFARPLPLADFDALTLDWPAPRVRPEAFDRAVAL